MPDCLPRVQVEDCLPGRVPAAAVEEEYGRGVAQVADGGQAFHVAPLDRLELDRDGSQRGELAGPAVAGEFDLRLPVTGLPAQAARLAAGGGLLKEAGFEMLPLA